MPALLHHLFEAAASAHPDALAVDVPPGPDRPARTRITYAALRTEALALAHRLLPLTAPDQIVLILLPRDSHLLYAAQLAVHYAGAAFTCLDPNFPDAHLHAVAHDSNAAILLTDQAGQARNLHLPHTIVLPPPPPLPAGEVAEALRGRRGKSGAPQAPRPQDPPSTRTSPHSLAYAIYTSGTTGAPKGVLIEHHSIVNLITSDLAEFKLAPGDRVAQGSSPAYDSSLEESWLALASGATLVVMDDAASRLGPDLIPWLQRERISVFCPPPTILRTTGCDRPDLELPLLKLLYVGGEALTPDLADRWARGRRLVNGYGPTECTVTVTRGDVLPGQPVTIGTPVPGHSALILDDQLTPVPEGAEGELCIAGPGLARGYRNLPDVTASKFPTVAPHGRLYRTGDLVRRTPAGDLEYLGRIDAQVKLRGYRIELEAVEAQLALLPGVREAACRVQGSSSNAFIAAHLIPTDPATPPDFDALRHALRETLPVYMIPARLALIDALPRTVGGKLDRKRLPDIAAPAAHPAPAREPQGPRNDLELAVARAFAASLQLAEPVSIHDDYFADLAGDSLTAVAVVVALRAGPATASITTRDLYQAPTVAALAQRLAAQDARHHIPRPPADPRRTSRPVLTTFLQALWLLAGLVLLSAAGYAGVYSAFPAALESVGIPWALALLPFAAALGALAYTTVAVAILAAVKWTVIGRYRPIAARAWSLYHLRCWIVEQTARLVPWNLLAGTAALSLVLRVLGAKVGRRVHIHHGVELNRGGWDLLTLGDDVALGCDSWLGLVELDSGCIRIAPVSLGDRAVVEVRGGVDGGAALEPDSCLTALSWLPAGRSIPRGQRWDGVPAFPAGPADPAPQLGRPMSPAAHGACLLAAVLLRRALAALPPFIALAVAAALSGAAPADVAHWLDQPTWSPKVGLWLVALPILWIPCSLVLQALALRAMGPVRPGVISRWSPAYLRVWLKAREVDAASRWLSGTVYWPLWLRLAGMPIGRNCEISTIIDVVPESISIGDECFFADGIYLGGPRISAGTVEVAATRLARGTFLGNHAVIPAGADLPPDYFAGVCTVGSQKGAPAGSSWFGHPAIRLHRREVVSADRSLTHDPTPIRVASRLFWETLRFTLPVLPIVIFSSCLAAIAALGAGRSWAFDAFLVAPLVALSAMALECLWVLVLKWLLLGRSGAGQHPLWSCWCSRWDFLYVAWQFYALSSLSSLQGTLLLNAFLRLTGARIGKRVLLGPGFAQLVDPDMLTIEDGATVNAAFQAHSFEDRVLKVAPVRIGRNATVGEQTVVFYGADVGEGAWVGPCGVVMKNEHLPPGSSFAGCPVQPVQTEPHAQADLRPAPRAAQPPRLDREADPDRYTDSQPHALRRADAR